MPKRKPSFKEQVLEIYLPTYQYLITFVYTNDLIKSRNDRAHKFNGRMVKEKHGSYIDGMHSYYKSEFEAFIFFTPHATYGTLAHECYHAVSRMYRMIGATHEEELFAYQLGYLIEKIVPFLTEHGYSSSK